MRNFADLEEILVEAAAGREVRRYFEARSIRTIGTLALVAKDEESLQRDVVAPLLTGWTVGTDVIQVASTEQPIVNAVILHAWTLARASWNKTLAAAHPPPTPTAHASPSATAAATSTTESKIPKTLPPGKWTELVNHYNNITVGSRPRSFPVKEVLGAEVIISRLYHERHVSKLYTPLQLGELLQHRSFTAAGDINPLVKGSRKHNALVLDDDRQLIETEEATWVPKSVLSVLDGISAARWALILAQHGEEEDLNSFAEFMQQRARSKPDKMEQFAAYWHSAMWKISMSMRNGDTFGAAMQGVINDMETFHDYMNKDVSSVRPKSKQAPKGDVPEKGSGKAGKSGKSSKSQSYYGPQRYGASPNRTRWTPYHPQRWNNWQHQQEHQHWRSEASSNASSWSEKSWK